MVTCQFPRRSLVKHVPLHAMAKKAKHPDWLVDGPAKAPLTIALAHGAGAPMDSRFMAYFAEQLAKQKLRVVRFEFPYMAERRASGKTKPPNRAPILCEAWHDVIEAIGPERLVIGGKSMGGRIASMVADDACVAGLVCLGYPFHPVGKPEKLRIDHLKDLKVPTLVLQGERDTFGNKEEVASYKLPRKIRVRWLRDGDHSFKPRKASGRSEQDNWDQAITEIVAFTERLL